MINTVLIAETDQTRFHADVAVVGSGAGASAVAGELRRRGANVIMVESGAALTPEPGAHLRNRGDTVAFMSAVMKLLWPDGRADVEVPGLPGLRSIHAVGGLLTAWAHNTPRPHLKYEWDGTFPAAELERHLTDAERVLGCTPDLYGAGSNRQVWVQSAIQEVLRTPARRVPVAAQRDENGTVQYAGADALLSGAPGSGALTILTGRTVRRVVHRDGRGLSIEAFDGTGTAVSIEADTVVVAAGVIGTPQILHASGLRHPALGRYLTDHLNVVSRVRLKQGAPVDDPNNSEAINLMVPVDESRPFHTGLLDIPSVAHAGELAGSAPGSTTDIGTFVGTEPNENSRLLFNDDILDAHGLPSVSAHIEMTLDDHRRVADAIAFQYQVARAIGEPWLGMTPTFRPYGAALHTMGTHRIGVDEERSVADGFGRLHGSPNIYVAGNGSLSSRNSANPTLTTVALGLRTAEHIAQARMP